MTHKVALIGLGGMGLKMLEDLAAHPAFTPTTVYEPNPDFAPSELPKDVQRVSDVDRILEGPIDLIYVASPPQTHVAYAHRAIDAGLPIFCEKPLGIDLSESRALADRVREAHTKMAVNFSHACAKDAVLAKQYLESGDLGSLSYVDMRLHLPKWPRAFQKTATWLSFRAQGGFTREVLSHWVFLTQRLLGVGEVRHSEVMYPTDPQRAECFLRGTLDFRGTPAFVTAGVGGRGPVGMEYTLWCERRSLRLSSGGPMMLFESDEWCTVGPPDPPQADRFRSLDHVAALLRGDPNTTASVHEALAVQTIIETLRRP